jgi:LemA protein
MAFGLFRYVVNTYDKAVAYEEAVIAQWGNVESSYQRRADLIPNLVTTVKAYSDYEKETLTRVIEARAKATSINIDPKNMTPETFQKFQQAQGELSSALSRLLVVMEKYPELKANQNYLDLQAELAGTENRINVERRKYNESVQIYNRHIRGLIRSLALRIAGGEFERKEVFKAEAGAEKAPKVEF